MSENKKKMVQRKDGVIERGYHPPKQDNSPGKPPTGEIPVSPPAKPQKSKK